MKPWPINNSGSRRPNLSRIDRHQTQWVEPISPLTGSEQRSVSARPQRLGRSVPTEQPNRDHEGLGTSARLRWRLAPVRHGWRFGRLGRSPHAGHPRTDRDRFLTHLVPQLAVDRRGHPQPRSWRRLCHSLLLPRRRPAGAEGRGCAPRGFARGRPRPGRCFRRRHAAGGAALGRARPGTAGRGPVAGWRFAGGSSPPFHTRGRPGFAGLGAQFRSCDLGPSRRASSAGPAEPAPDRVCLLGGLQP